ncbi:MAG TPA: LysM peptidoglycan-binding domain-containing protein [Tepidisphaeraceae bacterium]|jgi:LysM repeat protein|nr:LysM peptidoglycan-binding domain-containing protein [Tepidisphaeraceae bacterium]
MTRETKIGLLVGLAFIIVIGILLSDYNRNEIQNAPLAKVDENVRSSTATLHNDSNQSVAVPPPAAPVPSRQVPTAQDLRQGTIVDITPAPAPGGTPTLSAQSEQHPTPPVVGNTPGAVTPNPVPTEPVGPTGIPGTEWAGAHSPVTREPPVTPAPPAAPPAAPTPTVNGAKAYVAIAGDTVSKLAGRFMGGNTKTNREAIMAINPSLKANPNNVIVGRTYMIPPASKPAVATATTPARSAPVIPAVATTDGPHYFYTVKENDNLWKIAAEQLGDGTAWAAIKELNKDVLKGGENLRPNMRLRLPAKPLASTN